MLLDISDIYDTKFKIYGMILSIMLIRDRKNELIST